MIENECAPIWDLADWLTIEQAVSLWGCNDQTCVAARTAAITSAVERNEIETRDSATRPAWRFDCPEGLHKGWLEISRVSLAMWAEGLPESTRPKNPITKDVRIGDSHLRLLIALASKVGIDIHQRGSAAQLSAISEKAGLAVSQDSAERIVKRLKTYAR